MSKSAANSFFRNTNSSSTNLSAPTDFNKMNNTENRNLSSSTPNSQIEAFSLLGSNYRQLFPYYRTFARRTNSVAPPLDMAGWRKSFETFNENNNNDNNNNNNSSSNNDENNKRLSTSSSNIFTLPHEMEKNNKTDLKPKFVRYSSLDNLTIPEMERQIDDVDEEEKSHFNDRYKGEGRGGREGGGCASIGKKNGIDFESNFSSRNESRDQSQRSSWGRPVARGSLQNSPENSSNKHMLDFDDKIYDLNLSKRDKGQNNEKEKEKEKEKDRGIDKEKERKREEDRKKEEEKRKSLLFARRGSLCSVSDFDKNSDSDSDKEIKIKNEKEKEKQNQLTRGKEKEKEREKADFPLNNQYSKKLLLNFYLSFLF